MGGMGGNWGSGASGFFDGEGGGGHLHQSARQFFSILYSRFKALDGRLELDPTLMP